MGEADSGERDVLARLSKIKCIFSDLDGTLCHFDRHTKHHGAKVVEDEANGLATVHNREGEQRNCRLLPTSTMGAGVISDKTVELVHALRSAGVKFVIISGARTTTMLARYARLPLVDSVACETGVKILYPPPSASMTETPDPSVLELDSEWSKTFQNVTGPLDSSLPPSQRLGTLWDLYREMEELGLSPDARGYYGCFRVNCRDDETQLALLRPFVNHMSNLGERGISHAMNLGMHDFFPAKAGKGPAVKFLQAKWGLAPDECIALFDDDNDIKMVEQCGAGFLPGITSESVQNRLAIEPGWALAKRAGTGVFATEDILHTILNEVSERSLILKDDPVSV